MCTALGVYMHNKSVYLFFTPKGMKIFSCRAVNLYIFLAFEKWIFLWSKKYPQKHTQFEIFQETMLLRRNTLWFRESMFLLSFQCVCVCQASFFRYPKVFPTISFCDWNFLYMKGRALTVSMKNTFFLMNSSGYFGKNAGFDLLPVWSFWWTSRG